MVHRMGGAPWSGIGYGMSRGCMDGCVCVSRVLLDRWLCCSDARLCAVCEVPRVIPFGMHRDGVGVDARARDRERARTLGGDETFVRVE